MRQFTYLWRALNFVSLVSLISLLYSCNLYAYSLSSERSIVVSVANQQLYLYQNNKKIKTYPISTAAKGIGNQRGSNQTPLGKHRIGHKIGYQAKKGEVFVGRKSTGEVKTIFTDQTDTDDDFVMTRILWLDGLEKGINKGGNVDSESRFIYIHGTNEEGLIGKPASEGCIRMTNDSVIDLFNRVYVDDIVTIVLQ